MTKLANDLSKAIKNGTIKNVVKCEKCGNFHRFDYDCSKYLKAISKKA